MEYNNGKIQVVVAAVQFLYRLGIKTVLSVIGIEPELFEANSYNQVKSILKRNKCDFIIISEEVIPPPKCLSLDNLKKFCPNCKIMIIRDEIAEDCRYTNFLLNTENKKEVLEKFQDFFFEADIVNTDNESEKALLSDREIDVLKAVAMGSSNKEIADKLFISINTVITHRKNITDKLGIKSIAGLTVYAMMNNLIKPDEVKH